MNEKIRAVELKKMLSYLNISQKEISNASGVDPATVSRALNANNKMDKHSRIKYLTLFEDAMMKVADQRKKENTWCIADEIAIKEKFILNGLGQFLAAAKDFLDTEKINEQDMTLTSFEINALHVFIVNFLIITLKSPLEKRQEINNTYINNKITGAINTISLYMLVSEKIKECLFVPIEN